MPEYRILKDGEHPFYTPRLYVQIRRWWHWPVWVTTGDYRRYSDAKSAVRDMQARQVPRPKRFVIDHFSGPEDL